MRSNITEKELEIIDNIISEDKLLCSNPILRLETFINNRFNYRGKINSAKWGIDNDHRRCRYEFARDLVARQQYLDIEQRILNKEFIDRKNVDPRFLAKPEEVDALFCDLEQKCQDEVNIASIEHIKEVTKKEAVEQELEFLLGKDNHKIVDILDKRFGMSSKTDLGENDILPDPDPELINTKITFMYRLKKFIKDYIWQ